MGESPSNRKTAGFLTREKSGERKSIPDCVSYEVFVFYRFNGDAFGLRIQR